MSIWRKPTETEAAIVIKQEKSRIRWQRLGAVVLAVFVFFLVYLLVYISTLPEINTRMEEILGSDPDDRTIRMQTINADGKDKLEEMEKQIIAAREQALGEVWSTFAPMIVTTGILSGSACLLYFAISERRLRSFQQKKYEVALGDFEDKSVVPVSRHWLLYSVVARFEDGTTQEAKATKEVFEAATARTKILIVAVSNKVTQTKDMRIYVLANI